MTLYMVDKAIRQVVMHRDLAERFKKDPYAYLEGWNLTYEERKALAEFDYPKLYALGAHPFILWIWSRRVRTVTDLNAHMEDFRQKVRQYGYPDIAT